MAPPSSPITHLPHSSSILSSLPSSTLTSTISDLSLLSPQRPSLACLLLSSTIRRYSPILTLCLMLQQSSRARKASSTPTLINIPAPTNNPIQQSVHCRQQYRLSHTPTVTGQQQGTPSARQSYSGTTLLAHDLEGVHRWAVKRYSRRRSMAKKAKMILPQKKQRKGRLRYIISLVVSPRTNILILCPIIEQSMLWAWCYLW